MAKFSVTVEVEVDIEGMEYYDALDLILAEAEENLVHADVKPIVD